MTNSIHFTKANWNKEVLQADKPVVVDFWASWCGPCQMMGPVFEELASEYHAAGTAKLGKLSTEEEQEIPAQMGVRGIPSLIVFHKGKEVDRIVGFAPKALLKQRIDGIIKTTQGK